MVTRRKAEFYLLIVTLIWGLTFPVIGTAVQSIHPVSFVFMRFLVATLVLIPLVWKDLKNTNLSILGYGVLLGILNVSVYSFQSMGLTTISAAQSAFITAASVVLVPIFLLLFRRHSARPLDFICSALCLLGLYILTGAHLIALNSGELLTLMCAIGCAFTIIVIQIAGRKVKQFNLLVFYQILFTAFFALPLHLMQGETIAWNKQSVFALLFCAIFATVLVFYLQMKYQKYTTATKAALIFCAEPFFASLFAWLINGEQLTLHILIGGSIIAISVLLPEIPYLTGKVSTGALVGVSGEVGSSR